MDKELESLLVGFEARLAVMESICASLLALQIEAHPDLRRSIEERVRAAKEGKPHVIGESSEDREWAEEASATLNRIWELALNAARP